MVTISGATPVMATVSVIQFSVYILIVTIIGIIVTIIVIRKNILHPPPPTKNNKIKNPLQSHLQHITHRLRAVRTYKH